MIPVRSIAKCKKTNRVKWHKQLNNSHFETSGRFRAPDILELFKIIHLVRYNFLLAAQSLIHADYSKSKTRWNSTGCRRRLCLCLLWPWPMTFWPQNLTSTSITQIHLWPKLGVTPFTGFRDMVFTRFSGRTDPLTGGHTRKQNASEDFRRRRHNNAAYVAMGGPIEPVEWSIYMAARIQLNIELFPALNYRQILCGNCFGR